MSVVRRANLVFNNRTPGRGGQGYGIKSSWYTSGGVLVRFSRFVCGVFSIEGLHCICDRIQHQLLLAILYIPPIPPSRLAPLCPFGVDNTQALYPTCPSARLYLREPSSLSLELPLLGFWPCPPPPPSYLFCVSLTPSCFLLRPAVLYKYRHEQWLSRSVISSIWMHRKRLWAPTFPSCHLWSGCRMPVPGQLLCRTETRRGWLESVSVSGINLYLQVPKDPNAIVGLLTSQIGFFFSGHLSLPTYINSKLASCFSTYSSTVILSLPFSTRDCLSPHTSSI